MSRDVPSMLSNPRLSQSSHSPVFTLKHSLTSEQFVLSPILHSLKTLGYEVVLASTMPMLLGILAYSC